MNDATAFDTNEPSLLAHISWEQSPIDETAVMGEVGESRLIVNATYIHTENPQS